MNDNLNSHFKPTDAFKSLIRSYHSETLEEFEKTFSSLFTTTPLMVDNEIGVINALILENTKMHHYVSQIIMENVKDIKASHTQDPRKVENLICELKFAQLAYEKSFEENSQEIDGIENLIIEWTNLLAINKSFCAFLYGTRYTSNTKRSLEMVSDSKKILIDNMSKLQIPLKTLYKSQSEAVQLLNSIFLMKNSATKIYKDFKKNY